ncbi:MAG: PadR family transcriptional regulator [Candidatus Micrarchaeota archaeon]
MKTEKNPSKCDMRGFLSLYILWLLSKKSCYGQEIAKAIAKHRGQKPKPGTLYPALKVLEKKKLIKRIGIEKRIYELTPNGKQALKQAVTYFKKAFHEILK